MSSQPAEPDDRQTPPDTPSRRRPYEPWRKLALTGALILFVVSVLNAAIDGFPRAINMLSLGFGWGFLAAGFGRAMMDRRARERAAEKKPR
jgi:hypothetical protein